MKLHSHTYDQFLPISLDEAWDFFSKPGNLNEITPEDMQFEILTKDIQVDVSRSDHPIQRNSFSFCENGMGN